MSRTCCAPPHVSAANATVARAITRDNGAQPWCISLSSASGGNATLSSLTSHNLRVSSIVGNTVMVSPGVSFGTRNRLTPSSIVRPSRVRAARAGGESGARSPVAPRGGGAGGAGAAPLFWLWARQGGGRGAKGVRRLAGGQQGRGGQKLPLDNDPRPKKPGPAPAIFFGPG